VFSSSLENVDRACGEVERCLGRAGCASGAFKVRLGLREALTNAVVHGNGSDEGRLVSLYFAADELVRAEVVDQGGGFQPRPADFDLPGPEATGGRGLAIIKDCFEEVIYLENGRRLVLETSLPERGER
jgi:anti-sigma regulatory factor (Ser/Thr protein kinase)